MNTVAIPKMDGKEISPGIWIIGEPTPIPGTNNLRAMADVHGCLCLIELKMTFAHDEHEHSA